MPEQEFGSEPTVNKDSTDTAHCSTVPAEPRQPYQESASASDPIADGSPNPLDLSPSPEDAEQLEKARTLLRATIEPLHASLQSAVKKLLIPSLSVQGAVRNMLAPSQAMLAAAHFRLLESVAETARAQVGAMTALKRTVEAETTLRLQRLATIEHSLLRTERLVPQLTPVAKHAQSETLAIITRMVRETDMARRLLGEGLTLASLGTTASVEQAASRLLKGVTLPAVELARASLEPLRYFGSLAFAAAGIREVLVSVARTAASYLMRSIWHDLDPRIWWRLELRFMLSAVEEGHPEALEFAFRRLGIRNPQPEHREGLWRVLKQDGVWRAVERGDDPILYLRKAVRQEVKRIIAAREVSDKDLWHPTIRRNGRRINLDVEVLPLDAPVSNDDALVLADTLPADPILIGVPPASWDPLAAVELAEDRAILQRILAQLTREERRLLLLWGIVGYTPREAVRAVFPSLDGPRADGKWKAFQKRLRNAAKGRTRRPRRR